MRPVRRRPATTVERTAGRRDSGQAAVEFAVALPLVVIALLVIVQTGLVVRNEIAVQLAAREAARAAAVSADPATAADLAARRSVRLPVSVSTTTGGDTVSVTVRYTDPTNIAIIGAALGDVRHEATATMALEPP